jgi:predicted MFS family arabinose efflux permease
MSISARPRPSHPGTAARPRSRLVSGSFALVLVAALCMETSFFLLVSVTPMAAAADGASSAGAGLVTGVLLLGTVAAELASPVLMSRCGYRVTLAAGALLMGIPLLVQLAHGTFVITMIASLARGFGFGLGAVVLGALVPLLVPADRRGEGLALSGVFETVPGVVALPAGVWLAGHAGLAPVVIVAAVTALVPAAVVAWLPRRAGADDPGTASDQDRPIGLLAGLRQAGQRRPALIFAASTVAAGVVVSFLPLATGLSRNVAAAGLFAQALTGMAGRWGAGRLGDRLGHERLLPPALVIAAAGMVGLFWLASPVAVIAGMGLFGLGFGALQNATFTLMINRMPESGFGTASAIWNLAYDAGYGAGPAAFGVFVGVTGYPIAFAFSALLMVVALPLTRRPRPAAAARSARGGKRGEVVIQDRQRPLGSGMPGSCDELDAQPVK